jgi:hypothetical protein
MTNTKEFSYSLRSESAIVTRRWQSAALFWLSLVIWFFSLEAVLVVTKPRPTITEDIFGLFIIGLLCSFLFAVVIALPALNRLHLNPWRLEWLPSHLCRALADLCEEHEQLGVYRDKVRADARRFTYGEYLAMTAWAEEMKDEDLREQVAATRRADCQRLYGIEQGDGTEASD